MDVATERTIPAVLAAGARRFADHVAVADGDDRPTYAELADRALRVARAALAIGVRHGDRVGLWAPNSARWVEVSFGLHMAGAVVVPLNTRYRGAEAREILARVRAELVFVASGFLGFDYVGAATIPTGDAAVEAVEGDAALASLRVVDVSADQPAPAGPAMGRVLGWREFLRAAEEVPVERARAAADAVRPEDVSEIIFTSGTTGRAKGVQLAHGPALDLYATYARLWGLREGDRYLVTLPFFHTGGNKAGMLVSLQHGLTVVPTPVFDVEETMRLIERERVSVTNAPPTVYHALLDSPARERFDLTSLRLGATGAAVVPESMIRRARTELPYERLITAYGMTECVGTATMCRDDDPPETVATTNGRALPGIELRVVDPDGADVVTGSPGEVLVRGPHVTPGYWEDDRATAEAIDPEGWLHTGDVGHLDPAGNLKITDRIKDLFLVGGFNVSPAEVEQVLGRHPAVGEIAVIGVPDDRLGEVAKAFVILARDATASEREIVDWARERIANFKVPRTVEFVETLPRNASGKVLKRELRRPGSGALVAAVERGFALFARGDLDGALAAYADDVVMVEGGANIRSGIHRGREGVKALLQLVHAETDRFSAVRQRVDGDDERVVSLAHATGTRLGRALDTHVVTVFEGREGVVTEIRDLPYDWAAWEAFWAPDNDVPE